MLFPTIHKGIVTFPFPVTAATFLFDDFQTIFPLAFFSFNEIVCPTAITAVFLFNLTVAALTAVGLVAAKREQIKIMAVRMSVNTFLDLFMFRLLYVLVVNYIYTREPNDLPASLQCFKQNSKSFGKYVCS